jgi:hypothetical protein
MEVETNEHVLKNKLFDEIIQRPDVFYRSQQRDEPEISVDEKRSILNTLFNTKPAVFLERYHNLIDKGKAFYLRNNFKSLFRIY